MKQSSRKVLILDPRNAYGPMLGRLERRRGVRVETVKEAASAMRRLASSDYDCVIVDADAPGARSQGFLSALRSCAPAAKVLMLVPRRIEELPLEHEEGVYYCQVLKPTG